MVMIDNHKTNTDNNHSGTDNDNIKSNKKHSNIANLRNDLFENRETV